MTEGSKDYSNPDVKLEDLAEPTTVEEKFVFTNRFDKLYGVNFKLSPWIDPEYDDTVMGEEEIKLERIKRKLNMNRALDLAEKRGDEKTIKLIKELMSHERNGVDCYGF